MVGDAEARGSVRELNDSVLHLEVTPEDLGRVRGGVGHHAGVFATSGDAHGDAGGGAGGQDQLSQWRELELQAMGRLNEERLLCRRRRRGRRRRCGLGKSRDRVCAVLELDDLMHVAVVSVHRGLVASRHEGAHHVPRSGWC